MRFVVEFRNKCSDQPGAIPSLNSVEAETLQLATREAEKVLQSGAVDEAIVYQPVLSLKGARVVTRSELVPRPTNEVFSAAMQSDQSSTLQ